MMEQRISLIYHLPFMPNDKLASASQIRPMKILKAFISQGYEVDVIMGEGKTRKAQMAMIKEKIRKGKKYDFLYSESATIPTLLTERHHLPTYPFLDFSFLAYCKRHRIPIGLFYRDIHWRFEQYTKEVPLFYRLYSTFFFKWDLFQYKKCVDIVYLPSLRMLKYIPELKGMIVKELPPGGENGDIETVQQTPKDISVRKILYVGGVGRLYNLRLLVETLAQGGFERVSLTICCRPSDYDKVQKGLHRYIDGNQITVVHKKGDELKELYSQHEICCLYVDPIDYWDFAMPVKLFEYISFMKPILAVEGTYVGEFVSNNKVGWSIPYNRNDLVSFLEKLNRGEEKQIDVENYERVKNSTTWGSRVMEIANSLTEKYSGDKS